MKKNEVLKAVVIVQAVCMIALTGMVIVKFWPASPMREGEQILQPSPDPEKTADIVASIGSESITRQQLTTELYEQYGDEVLRTMLVRKAIDLEAGAYQIRVTQEELDRELAHSIEGYDNEEQFYTVMREQLGMTKQQVLDELRYRLLLEKITVRSVDVTDDEVNAYISEHPELFEPQLQLHLQWIVTETEKEAKQLLQSLANGNDFALLAQTYSIDSFTADSGGDLGMIQADDPFYDEDMLKMARGMDTGEIAGPIPVDAGYAVIQLLGRKMTTVEMGQRRLDAVRKQLALERAKSMSQVEEELLDKYDARITK